MSERPILIVGGGVIGVCSAYYLARRGAPVIVIERDEIGGAASFGNAGSIAPGHLPINKPGRTMQAVRWMFSDTSPLYVAPRPDPGLLAWLWRFRSFNTDAHIEHCMEALGPLGHESQRLYDELIAEEKIDCDYRREGYYEVFRTAAGLAECASDLDLLRRHEYLPTVLGGEEMRAREPSLLPGVRGAIRHEEAAICHPHRFVTGLAERAAGLGAVLRPGVSIRRVLVRDGRVRGVESETGEVLESETVVLATGAYSGRLLRDLGVPLPIQPAKGYHRDAEPDGGAPRMRTACILGEAFIFVAPIGDFVRFAGTLEFSGVNDAIRPARLRQLTVGAREYLAGVEDRGTRSEWCGLRPCLPDGLPAIGPMSGIAGLWVANGHAMMGLTLGPVTGRVLADGILDGRVSGAARALDPRRFP